MKQPSIRKNFLMNAMLTMSSFLFPLITFPYVSRILLPAGTGTVSFATSVVAYFNMFAQLGIPTYGIRACAKVRDDREALTRTAHELLLLNLLMSVVSYLVLAVCLVTVPRLRAERTLIVVISFTIVLSAVGMEWLYKALEQYTYITIRSIVFKFVALIAMFLLVHREEDYIVYGGITILAASASNILNFLNAHRYISMRPVGGYDLRRHLKPVAVFFAMACATTIYTNLDTVMLGFMTTKVDVGYYNAAVKIKTILVSIVTALGAVLLPRASYYIEHGEMERFHEITRKSLRFVLLLATPLMLYFIFFAREGVRLLSGPAYDGAILPMQLIMPTLLLIGLTNILGLQMLVPLGQERVVLRSEIAGAVTDVVLNAILIPRYASAGAAVGTLAAELVVLIVQYHALRAQVRETFLRLPYGKVLLSLATASAAAVWVKRLGWSAFPALAVSAVLFFAVYGGVLLLTREPLTTELVGDAASKLKAFKQRI